MRAIGCLSMCGVICGGELVLAIDPSSKKAPKLAQALKAWLAQIDSEKSGEITSEQLAEWKAKFGA